MTEPRTLLIGYGNPARGDDGLGQAFAEAIAARHLPGLTVQSDYQLSTEHAHDIMGYDRVVFADALLGANEPFVFEPVHALLSDGLASHCLQPSAVLSLAALLFDANPSAFTLGIQGTEFGAISEGLSAGSRTNLDAAVRFFEEWSRTSRAKDGYDH